ncbi:hypothetical protein RUE5091_00899 [Ruegeria denitrificans]|uniref:DUF2147 domain-containing protein n=1 Tax=Ruegeria denitrificans TaxID=1715692 RepID=A0A0P1I4K4_9RHOB|nr:DUF2147 domain-containing protein [Ruegeria denitrificans]CUJ89611.1 hypothetical protein RUE5091_00899 [Ruegeria denitrificans]
MRRLKRNVLISVVISLLVPAMAAADPIVGVWETEPDRKNLISHIKISACGDKFCGQIQSAYDKSGKEVKTPNIGKKLFWDVASEGGGKYGGGDFWIPMVNVDVVPQMTLNGDSLTVRGCEHVVCGHQKWTRLSK